MELAFYQVSIEKEIFIMKFEFKCKILDVPIYFPVKKQQQQLFRMPYGPKYLLRMETEKELMR